MIWTPESTRYCLLSFAAWEKEESDHYVKGEIPLSGLFNWSLALKGERAFPRTREAVNKYNLIHVNITANNLNIVPQLNDIVDRQQTKLMYNVDYAIEMWYPSFKFPAHFLRELDKADYIFAVEEEMAYILSRLLKRKIACIPHPCATHILKPMMKTGHDARRAEIGVSVHAYEKNYLLPMLAFRMAGLTNTKWQSTMIGHVDNPTEMAHEYTNVLTHINFPDLMKHVAEMYAMLESYTLHSYGRLTIECAALAIPVVGADCVSSQRVLYPDLTTGVNQISKQAELLKRLVEDQQFYTECAQKAFDLVDRYSFESCSDLMFQFLNTEQ